MGDYLTVSSETNTSLLYSREDVLSVSKDAGVVNQILFQGRSYAGSSLKNYRIVNHDDVVYTKSPLRENPYGIIKTNLGNSGIVSTLYAVYSPKQGLYSPFLNSYFASVIRVNNYLRPLVNKGAKNDMKVRNAHVLTGAVSFPSIQEQRRISDFFSALDNLIAAAERQEALLRRKKQAYLQLMFPRERETQPRLRFAGFRGEWERRQLSEVAEFSKGQGYSKADLCSSGTPTFLYGRMYTDYKLLITESDQYLPQNSDGVFSTAGDVIIPASGESPEEIAIASVIGKTGILLGGDLNIIKPERSVLDSIFLALSASVGRLHNNLVSRAQGKTIVHLHNSDIATCRIGFPSLPEQHCIGEFFTALESVIAAAEKRTESLHTLKSAYLQRMFV